MKNIDPRSPHTIELIISQLETISELLKEKVMTEPIFYQSLDVNEALLLMTGHGYSLSKAHIYQFVLEFSIAYEIIHGKFLFDKDKFMSYFSCDKSNNGLEGVPTPEQVTGRTYLRENFERI